ncbi:hypothetical protein STEG23_029713, partial [Scotinomys teguina]
MGLPPQTANPGQLNQFENRLRLGLLLMLPSPQAAKGPRLQCSDSQWSTLPVSHPLLITAVRNVYSWQHQSTSEKMMGIEETSYEICFHCGIVSHWAKKLSLPKLLTVCCPNWTCRTQKKVTLYSNGIFDGVDDYIVTVFLSYDRRKIRYKTLDSP